MRQTLALVGIIRSITIRFGTSDGDAGNTRLFDVQLLVREDHPGTSSLYPIEALLRNAERPEHEAVFQARPGDRVELVGYWHGLEAGTPDGNLVPIQVFIIERFRKVDS